MDRCKHGHPLNAKTLRFFKQKKVLATGEVKEYSVRRCRFCTQAVENRRVKRRREEAVGASA